MASEQFQVESASKDIQSHVLLNSRHCQAVELEHMVDVQAIEGLEARQTKLVVRRYVLTIVL